MDCSAHSNFTSYDEWFYKNVDPIFLTNFRETEFTNEVNDSFSEMATQNIIIGSSETFLERISSYF